MNDQSADNGPAAAPGAAVAGALGQPAPNVPAGPPTASQGLLGVDVAGAIMQSVERVGEELANRLKAIVDQANDLLEIVRQHQSEVEANLQARDEATRAVLKRHYELADMIALECNASETALKHIAEGFRETAAAVRPIDESEPERTSYRAENGESDYAD